MAATKEALVIILDVGPYMNNGSSDQASPLDVAKDCIGKILQRKIFSESKDEIALVVYGTTETKNDLALTADGEYLNISVLRGLHPANFELMKTVETVKGTKISADFIDAMVVGMNVLIEQTKGQKFGNFQLLLFTNFGGEAFDDQIDVITSGIKNANIQLVVISPQSLDEDDEAQMFGNQKVKSEVRHKPAKSLAKKIVNEVGGVCYTFSEALPVLTYYQRKKIHSLAWNATLEIGESLQIPITACIKVAESKPKSWKDAHAVNPDTELIKDRTYHLNDDNQTQVDKEYLIQGYKYGTTLVPYTKEDEENMKYKSGEKGMKIVGFTRDTNIKRHYYMGNKTMYVTGRKNDEPSQMAITALIYALYNTNSVAIVRHVYAANSPPRMGFLAPRIKQSYKVLYFIQLPYVEDVRSYPFASLNAKKSNIPTDEQLDAIDNLITAMDLSTAVEDEEGEMEALKPSNNKNPYITRLFQCLQHRAFNPGQPLPPMPPYLSEMIHPPEKLVESAKPILGDIKRLFPLEPVIQKKSTETGAAVFQNGAKGESSEPSSKRSRTDDAAGGMADVLMGPVSEVGTVTPVEDFKKILAQDGAKFSDACSLLQNVVLQLIHNPRGGSLLAKILDCLKAYREEAVQKDPNIFNTFMQEIKPVVVKQYSSLWELIVQNKISLINSNENSKSKVSQMESADYLSQFSQNEDIKEEIEEDADDMLDMM